MGRLALLAVLLTASVASADDYIADPLDVHAQGGEPAAYAAAGLVLDQSQGFLSNGGVAELGQRLGRSPWFVHVLGQAGAIRRSDEPGTGTFFEVRAGLEARSCRSGGMVCGSAGLDLGFHRGDFTHVTFENGGQRVETPESLDGLEAVPRFTIDAGGRLRVRASLELPLRMRNADSVQPGVAARTSTEMPPATDHQLETGLAITCGLAVGF
jgi:hypothetical protein